jgi:hypothetical protein
MLWVALGICCCLLPLVYIGYFSYRATCQPFTFLPMVSSCVKIPFLLTLRPF